MGTRFIRDKQPPQILVLDNAAITLEVEDIRSEFIIGNALKIKLQQKSGSELDWVTITEGNPFVIKFELKGLEVGDYTLILETIDENSKVQSVLKTDVVTLRIPPSCQFSGSDLLIAKITEPISIKYALG